MRSFTTALSCSLFGLLAGLLGCSNGSDPQQAGNLLSPAGASGAASADGSAAAGAPGTNAGQTEQAPPPAANGNATGSEGMNVGGLVAPTGGAGPGNSGSAAMPDAGSRPVVSAACPPGPFPASPLPAGATPQAICSGMTFIEGAVWFQNLQTLFFSDFQIRDAASNFNGRILSYQPGGQCQELIPNAGTNGLVIAPDGNLLGARHLDQSLTIFDLTTHQPTVLVADFGGAAFNSPNDIAVRSDGNLYFTDPEYMRGNRAAELPTQAYRRDPNGVLSVIDPTATPNGITLSPDEKKLYLSHLGGPNDVVVFDVDASGALSNRQPFLNVGSDGMAIDCAGNLYITQGGVRVYSPTGTLLGTLAAPGAANVAFGGPDRRTLYITATTTLFAVDLAIPGLPY